MWTNINGLTSNYRPTDIWRDGHRLSQADITDEMLANDGWSGYDEPPVETITTSTIS
jgi:hypothetical protein